MKEKTTTKTNKKQKTNRNKKKKTGIKLLGGAKYFHKQQQHKGLMPMLGDEWKMALRYFQAMEILFKFSILKCSGIQKNGEKSVYIQASIYTIFLGK